MLQSGRLAVWGGGWPAIGFWMDMCMCARVCVCVYIYIWATIRVTAIWRYFGVCRARNTVQDVEGQAVTMREMFVDLRFYEGGEGRAIGHYLLRTS